MRKHVSNRRSVGPDIDLRSASRGNVNAPAVERIEVGPALTKSRVGRLHGRPYPVQFRNQGAFDAWKQALGSGPEWTRRADSEATCWSLRQEIQQQLNAMRVGRHDSMEAEARAQVDARLQAISISANLKYELQQGAIIEATPALETLLLNSDMDLDLPMKMVAPPYPAQYLKFGPEAARHLKDRTRICQAVCSMACSAFLRRHRVAMATKKNGRSNSFSSTSAKTALVVTWHCWAERNVMRSPWASGSTVFSTRRRGDRSSLSTSLCTRR